MQVVDGKLHRWWGDKNLIDFLKLIDKQGHVMRETQDIYNCNLAYYLAIRFCKEHDLIECDGIEENQMKKWSLTDNGKKFIKHIKGIEGLLYEE